MSQSKPSIGFLLGDVSRAMRRTFQQRIAGCNLTLAQAKALRYASMNEGVRQVELADVLEVQPITVARLIDQLEEAGLVERRPDPADRRAHLIFLTAAAAPELAAIEKVVTAILKEAMQGLTREQEATVIDALSRMRENLATR